MLSCDCAAGKEGERVLQVRRPGGCWQMYFMSLSQFTDCPAGVD